MKGTWIDVERSKLRCLMALRNPVKVLGAHSVVVYGKYATRHRPHVQAWLTDSSSDKAPAVAKLECCGTRSASAGSLATA